jgi:2'-5' RNA ligase
MGSKMDNKRIFIGFDISYAAKAACSSHIEQLREKFPDVRVGWELPEKLHITLKFLGNSSVQVISQLDARVAEIAEKHEQFSLRLLRSGVFPRPSRPRVLWIGAEDRPPVIQPLYAEIETACEEFEFPKEEKAFRPHITIGRIRDPYAAGELAEAHLAKKMEPVEFEVRDVVIYESKLQPTGSVYSAVSRHRLGTSI